MPIFEFKCNDCGHKFEELVLNSGAGAKCPSCGSENTGKLMSTFASSVTGGASSGPSCGSGFS